MRSGIHGLKLAGTGLGPKKREIFDHRTRNFLAGNEELGPIWTYLVARESLFVIVHNCVKITSSAQN